VTDRGDIGLGPHNTKPGDKVSVFLGCETPILLRSDNSIRDQFKIVGETYCHGYMCGESLLGPLPPHYQHMVIQHESRIRHGYHNRKTGEVEGEDPRLVSVEMPDGWKKECEQQPGLSHEWFFGTNGKEKPHATWEDPRLTADALRNRGVRLEKFTLV